MDEDLLAEFFSRIAGAFIFIVGITSTSLVFNQVDSFSVQVKENYANDASYAEATYEETDESIISRDELIARLMMCPQKNMIIKVDARGVDYPAHCIEISCGIGLDNVVRHEENNLLTSNAEVITMGVGRWDYTKLDLSTWLHASVYQVSDVTDADGNVISVMYWGKS